MHRKTAKVFRHHIIFFPAFKRRRWSVQRQLSWKQTLKHDYLSWFQPSPGAPYQASTCPARTRLSLPPPCSNLPSPSERRRVEGRTGSWSSPRKKTAWRGRKSLGIKNTSLKLAALTDWWGFVQFCKVGKILTIPPKFSRNYVAKFAKCTFFGFFTLKTGLKILMYLYLRHFPEQLVALATPSNCPGLFSFHREIHRPKCLSGRLGRGPCGPGRKTI